MAKATKSRVFRKILFSYSVFEMLFCSGPIFGWASLAYILKKEAYFSDQCLKTGSYNVSNSYDMAVCPSQEKSLNIAYTVGFITVGMVSFPVGYLLDICGPKRVRYISTALFGISSAIWISMSNETQYLMYPAVLTLSAAGVFCSFAFFQVSAFLCHNHQSTILGLQNGAFNASAVVLHIVKVLYEVQDLFRLEMLLALYCGFSAILVFLATAIIVPSKEELAAHAAARNDVNDALLEGIVDHNTTINVSHFDNTLANGNALPGFNEENKQTDNKHDEDVEKQLLDIQRKQVVADSDMKVQVLNDVTQATDDLKKSWSSHNLEGAIEIDKMKLTAFNIILQGSKISIDNLVDVVKKEEILNEDAAKVNKVPLFKMLISGIYLWHVFFACVFHLRQYFFVTTFENLLNKLTGGNERTVNQYINILGIGQFIGVVFAPVLGPYIDRNPQLPLKASYEDYRIWKIKRCAVALRITCTINVIMSVSVLIPVLEVQILAIVAQVLLRGFFYAVHFTYFAVVFPPEHYGKLTCLSLLMGVLFGSLQYPLCMLTESKFSNDPFWVNVALLISSLLVYGQTVHLKRYVKKK